MPSTKFLLNWTYYSGTDNNWSFKMVVIATMTINNLEILKDFSSSESPCRSDVSHHVSAGDMV